MTFAARSEYTKLGKGSLMVDMIDPTTLLPVGLQFMGNASGISFSANVTKAELFTSTQASGALVSSAVTRESLLVSMTLSELTMQNLANFLLGKIAAISQSSGTAATKAFTSVKEGFYYEIGARRITNVSAVKTAGSIALTLGTDYDLNSEYGIIYIRPGSPVLADGDGVTVTYDKPSLPTGKKVQIGTSASPVGRLVYLADDSNADGVGSRDRVELWKVNFAPNGQLNVISEQYNTFQLDAALLSDGSNHPTEPYGVWERVAAAGTSGF
jgi:hypothetical protein